MASRYGRTLAHELFALADLLFEHETTGGLYWLVSTASLRELARAPGV